MSDFGDFNPQLNLRGLVIGLVLFLAALGAAVVLRSVVPQREPTHAKPAQQAQPTRPIVEIVRPQTGLPDLSALVSRLCPSVAVIVPQGSLPPSAGGQSDPLPAASMYSNDGWLVTSSANLPDGAMDALFGDGERLPVTDQRSDPVSGLTVLRTASDANPIGYSDQAFPQVGQFGLVLDTARGTGCSAALAMIGSDFIADGAGSSGYVRLQPPPSMWAPGVPVVGSDGQVIGIGAGGSSGTVVPASIASIIIDELIRDSLAPSAAFGFRAVDFAAPISDRLGDVRSGATVALVQPKSSASKANLHAGDVVLAVGDSPVSSASELNRMLDAAKGKVTLNVQRGSSNLSIVIRKVS